jgi:hypothetical protein
MKYPELSRFLNRRQVEISTERGYIVTQKQLADESDTSPRSMGHWFDGNAMPEPTSWSGLYNVFGKGFYTAVGHPELEPKKINPKIQWMLDNQHDPNVVAYLDLLEQKGKDEYRVPDKIIRNMSIGHVTS